MTEIDRIEFDRSAPLDPIPPSKSEPKWRVGQAVVVSRQRSREVVLHDAAITTVGRKWLTVSCGYALERFGFDGRGEQDWGHPPQLWASREAYEAHQDRIAAWRHLASEVRLSNHPPPNVTTEQIDAALAVLFPNAPPRSAALAKSEGRG